MKFFGFLGKAGRHRRALSMGESLRNYQKMELTNQLVAGMAHDLKNLLAIIVSNCELLTQNDLPPHVYMSVEKILKAANQSSEFLGRLLAFSRGEIPTADMVNIDSVLREMELLLRGTLHAKVNLELNLRAGGSLTAINRSYLEQIVLNLVLNSRDALPERGGEIAVRTCTLSISGKSLMASTLSAGSYVLLEVSDNGSGIDSDTRPHIFKPFFTTKTESTGLGLSVVNQLASMSGGEVRVTSIRGRGTTVRVLLPDSSKSVLAKAEGWRASGRRVVDSSQDCQNEIPFVWLQRRSLPALAGGTGRKGF